MMNLQRSSLVLALTLTVCATAPAWETAPGERATPTVARPATEPSAPFSLGVRLIRLTGEGSTRRALIELNLFSRTEVENLSIDRRAGRVPGAPIPVALPENSRRLTAWNARKVQLSLDLNEELVHHLRFTASGEGRAGGSRRATAYLRVDLDPESMGRRLDMEDHDLIQYGPARGGE
jgi:hypothetical protein